MSSLTVSPNPAPELRPSGSDASASLPGEAGDFRDLVGVPFAPEDADNDAPGSTPPPAKDSSKDDPSTEEDTDYGAVAGQASLATPAAAVPVAAHLSRAASESSGHLTPVKSVPATPVAGQPQQPAVAFAAPSSPSSAAAAADSPPPAAASSVSAASSRAPEPATTDPSALRAVRQDGAESQPRPTTESKPVLPAAPGRPGPQAAPALSGNVIPAVTKNAAGENVADFLGFQAVIEVNQAPLAAPALPAGRVAAGETGPARIARCGSCPRLSTLPTRPPPPTRKVKPASRRSPPFPPPTAPNR